MLAKGCAYLVFRKEGELLTQGEKTVNIVDYITEDHAESFWSGHMTGQRLDSYTLQYRFEMCRVERLAGAED